MIVVLNNKSNFTPEEFKSYLEKLEKIDYSELILCPTFINLALAGDKIELGAQDVSPYDDGAHTGEISAKQLKTLGVKYSLVGHSERREFESEEELLNEIKKLFENDMIPILCVGESKEERENNKVEEVLDKELYNVINNLSREEQEKLIIAYEPVWSIGTGAIPTNDEIREVLRYIKNLLPNTKVLYGGSANEENIDTLKEIEEIDGYLLGGISLDIDRLQALLDKLS